MENGIKNQAARSRRQARNASERIFSAAWAVFLSLACTGTLYAGDAAAGGAAGSDTLLNFQTDLFTGRFSYSIPIAVAPARQGAEPKLALAYNSAAGNGWCGVGWTLEIGSIERDTRRGVPVKWSGTSPLTEYDDAGGFIFSLGGVSGNLVNVGGNVYRNEFDGAFLKFVFNENNWVITDKSGNTFHLGQASASRMENPAWSSGLAKTTYRWALDKVVDVNGNETTISYTKNENLLYLDEILYNGHTNGISKTHSVKFNLEDRPDPTISYRSNFRVILKKRLSEIIVKIGSTRIRRYALQYSTSSSTLRSLIQSVTLYGPTDSDSLPPTTFAYQVKPFEFESAVNWGGINGQGDSGNGWTGLGARYFEASSGNNTTYASLADMDGDGLPDRVMRSRVSPWNEQFYVQRNTGSNFVSATTNWSPLTSQGQTDSYWNGVHFSDGNGYTMVSHQDANGDGYPDRVLLKVGSPFNKYYIETNSGLPGSSAFSGDIEWSPIEHESQTSVDWLAISTLWNSSGYSSTTVDFFDITGDGLPDRVMRKWSANYTYLVFQRNTGSGFAAWQKFGDLLTQSQTPNSYWGAPSMSYLDGNDNYTLVRMLDINGDGLADRVMRQWTTPFTHLVVQLNNGAGFAGVEDNWSPIDGQSGTYTWYCSDSVYLSGHSKDIVRMTDINGDGLPDRVMMKRLSTYTVFKVQLNTGFGFSTNTYDFGPIEGGTGDTDPWMRSLRFTEAHNQGASDLLFATVLDLVDINGDGLPDRVWRHDASTWKVQFNKGPLPDLLKEINNGIGGKVQVTYKPSTQYDNRDRDWTTDPWAEGAKSLLPFPVYTVSTVTTSDGLGAANTTTYNYRGGMWDGKRREFRGFNCVEMIDPLGTRRLTYFHQGGGRDETANGEFQDANSAVKKGLPYRVETVGNDGLLYNVTLNKIEEVMLHANGWCFPYVSQTIQMEYEGLSNYRATATQLQYDTNTGNVVKSSNLGEVTNIVASTHSFTDVGSDSIYTHTEYATLSNTNILNKPSSIRISSDSGGSTKLRETLFAYEGARGNLTNNQVWLSNSVYITARSIAYDSYGNPLRVTDAAGITTTNYYDTTYQMFPVLQVTAGFTNDTMYDARAGNVVSSTDAKGLVVSNVYDAFFRLKESYISTNAYGAANLWRVKVDYVLKGVTNNYSTNFVRKRIFDAVDAVNGHDSYTYADGFGRTAQTRVEAENGQFRVSDVLYDERGNANFATLPYFSSGTNFTILSGSYLGTVTDYDPIGRAFQVTPAINASFDSSGNLLSVTETGGDPSSPVDATVTAFKDSSNPWATVVTDPENKVKKSYHDAFGRTTQIVEATAGGSFTTTYKYDLIGNMTNVTDHAGNSTKIVYDNLGRKTRMTEPNMGTWSYTYDNAGRLTQQTDAKDQRLGFIYSDPLGRLTTKNIYAPNGSLSNSVTYHYDTSDDGAFTVFKGQLFKVVDKEGWEKNSYDVRGRVLKARRHVTVMATAYTIETAYDDADRVSEILYPGSAARIRYTYDTAGNLSNVVSVAGTGTSAKEYFYRLGAVNALGQVTAYTNGNDGVRVVTANTFYTNSTRLKRMQVMQTGGAYVQDLTNTFDKVSNIKSITDLVYSGSASASLSNIQYDDLHRLTRVDNASGTKIYGYNAIGNVLTNGDTGTGLYSYSASKPHAVSTANGKSYYYDTNGNMITRGTQTLYYDEENRLGQVWNSAGPPPVYFGYAHDGTRLWRRKGSSDYTVWIGGIYEIRGVKTLCHVFAGGKRIATFEPAGGGPYAFMPQLYDWTKRAERAVVWPLQEGRTPWTVLLCILLGFLAVSVGSRLCDPSARGRAVAPSTAASSVSARSRRRFSLSFLFAPVLQPPRFRPAPFWQQLISLLVIVSLIFTTTQTNVYAQVYDPVFYYYHSDHLGSSNVITDRSGNVVQHYEYASYGNERYKHNTSAYPVSNRYTDQILDEDTGLYYYNARYYDPELARFCQPDTIVPSPGNPQALNRYSYVINNPLKSTDPTGHFWEAALVVLGYFVAGAAIGAGVSAAVAAATGGDVGRAAVGGALSGGLGGVGGPLGSIAGSVCAAAIYGEDLGKAALTATISAVISFGVSYYVQVPDSVYGDLLGFAVSAGAGAASGAASAAIYGGDIGEGALNGAIGGAIGYALTTDLADSIGNELGANRFHLVWGVILDAVPQSWLDNAASFGAGLGDALSFGLTRHLRHAADLDERVNYTNGLYTGGTVTGAVFMTVATAGGSAPANGASLALATTRTVGSHTALRMAQRGVTDKMVSTALRKGTTYWDPKNKTVNYILKNGFASGKDLLVGMNPLSGKVTTVIRGESLVAKRLVPF